MPQTQPWTIGRLLQWTGDYLKSHGATSPRLDAEVLLAHAWGRPRIELYTSYDQDPGDDVRSAFREFVRRRAEGEPVAYLVGYREFYSLSFEVSSDVLIPRPETEFVVIALLDAIKAHASTERPLEIADVGTGSGVIAICAAKHVAKGRFSAVDISPSALDVARRNAQAHGVLDRIDLFESDLLESLPADLRFDFVVSNPPYVAEGELEQTLPEVWKYEPRVALVAGPQGDEVIDRLVPQAAARLQTGGALICEISPMLEQRVCRILDNDDRFVTQSIVKDLGGLARVVVAQRR